jgi:hypothetical protein
MAPSRTGNTCCLQDVLQLAFLNDFFLLSMGYGQKSTSESAIVDFERTDIQNLEEIGVLSRFWRKTGEIHRAIRHAKTRTEVL